MKLKVLTLNCWAIPFPMFCQDRAFRIKKIGEKIASDDYDIVSLQEIWSDNDFDYLRQSLSDVLPFCHYFHSGMIGSGVCIFSRHPILASLMHRYTLNGYAHHIHRGDWFGGKVVGLAKIDLLMNEDVIHINLYSTHIHAEYDRTADLYLAHRTAQAYELSNFIRHTLAGSDLCLLLGDLNLEPNDLGHQIVMNNGGLRDAWIDRKKPIDAENAGVTSDKPGNCYKPESQKIICPEGKRIDYILYKHSNNLTVSVDFCQVTMEQISNDLPHFYSDHSAVEAIFDVEIMKNAIPNGPIEEDQRSEWLSIQERTLSILEEGILTVWKWQKLYFIGLTAIMICMLITIDIELKIPQLAFLLMFLRFSCTVIVAYLSWLGLVGLWMERKSLLAVRSDILLDLSLHKR